MNEFIIRGFIGYMVYCILRGIIRFIFSMTFVCMIAAFICWHYVASISNIFTNPFTNTITVMDVRVNGYSDYYKTDDYGYDILHGVKFAIVRLSNNYATNHSIKEMVCNSPNGKITLIPEVPKMPVMAPATRLYASPWKSKQSEYEYIFVEKHKGKINDDLTNCVVS